MLDKEPVGQFRIDMVAASEPDFQAPFVVPDDHLSVSGALLQSRHRRHMFTRFSAPIFYYGFGEELLAVPTGDGVDEARNRRALYMVGANPPPAGSGVPTVGWRAL